MKRILACSGVALALFAGGWMSAERAGQPEGGAQMGPALIVKMMEEAGKATPEHEFLGRLVGMWDFTFTFMAPGMPPTEHSGRCEFKPALGGRCLQYDVDMELCILEARLPTRGLGVIGYNRHTGEYQTMWVDTLDPYMIFQTGKKVGDRIETVGLSYSEGQEVMMKSTWVFHDEKRFDLEFHARAGEGGEWIKQGVIEHRR
ncbi:MAG: DUF1579 domain-containing protein [Phycisphaerales bacterium]|nr:DUF1579 domain-containing protein [Phycisphaerales bacterium]